MHEFKTGRRGVFVVALQRQSPRVELKTGNQQAVRRQAVGELADHGAFGPRRQKDHHVACRHHDVELGVHSRVPLDKIGVHPGQFGCLGARGVQHRGIGIDPDHGEPAVRQFDCHPAGAAPRVQYSGATRVAQQVRNEIGLAVDALAGGSQLGPAGVVVVASGQGGVLPAGAHNTTLEGRGAIVVAHHCIAATPGRPKL